MDKRNSIYYEFWRNDVGLVKTGFRVIGSVQITTGIDTVPTMSLTLPLDELPEKSGAMQLGGLVGLETNFANYTIRVYFYQNGVLKYKFSGIVDKTQLSYADFTMTLSLSHVVAKMRDWVMPANYIVKNMPVTEVIGETQLNLGSPSTPVVANDGNFRVNFNVIYDGERNIETTFSSTNKLSALSEICENTEDLHWRVELGAESISGDNVETAQITISTFADQGKSCLISPSPVPDDECDEVNQEEYVTMLTEPVHQVDYTNHFNRAVVFCGDVNADVLHLTLKPLYDLDEYRNNVAFPVGMYDKEINTQEETKYEDADSDEDTCAQSTINNEKFYETGSSLVYANNDNREYYVTDTEMLAADGGVVKHTVLNFSDLYPIPKMEEVNEKCETVEYMITDEDRLEITKRAYNRAVRKLKAQRPSNQYTFNCTALPSYISDGDKVTFAFVKKLIPNDVECEEDMKEIPVVSVNERIFVSKRVITFDAALNEYTTVTLDENLTFRDISAVEIQLSESVVVGGDGNGDGYGSSNAGNASTSTDKNWAIPDVTGFDLTDGADKYVPKHNSSSSSSSSSSNSALTTPNSMWDSHGNLLDPLTGLKLPGIGR